MCDEAIDSRLQGEAEVSSQAKAQGTWSVERGGAGEAKLETWKAIAEKEYVDWRVDVDWMMRGKTGAHERLEPTNQTDGIGAG